MPRPTFPITTARLLLRPFTPEDLLDVWAYQRRPEVARYMLWEPRTRQQAQAAVDQMVKETTLAKDGDCLSLAVFWPNAGAVVGQVELVLHSQHSRQGEVGYVFNPDYQGKDWRPRPPAPSLGGGSRTLTFTASSAGATPRTAHPQPSWNG